MEMRRKIDDDLPQLICHSFDPFGSPPPKSSVALDANGNTYMIMMNVLINVYMYKRVDAVIHFEYVPGIGSSEEERREAVRRTEESLSSP